MSNGPVPSVTPSTAPAHPGAQHASPSSTPSDFRLPVLQGVGPITISPNACASGDQCLGRMGYEYVEGQRVKTKQAVEATTRGAGIHEILLGASGHTGPQYGAMTGGATLCAEHRLANWQDSGVPLTYHEDGRPSIDWHESAKALAEYLALHWPQVVWQCEQELHVPLTPGISLVGRIDLWTPSPVVDIVDVKTSTGYNKGHATSVQSPYLNLQLLLYGKMVMHQTGRVPRLWQLCHNPQRTVTGKGANKVVQPFVTFHKQFACSEAMIEQAARFAVDMAQKRELLFRQSPADWQRSFQCDHPYQCPHLSDCKRDLGGHYNTGSDPQRGVHVRVDNARTYQVSATDMASLEQGLGGGK